jgi:hypothetical protein
VVRIKVLLYLTLGQFMKIQVDQQFGGIWGDLDAICTTFISQSFSTVATSSLDPATQEGGPPAPMGIELERQIIF